MLHTKTAAVPAVQTTEKGHTMVWRDNCGAPLAIFNTEFAFKHSGLTRRVTPPARVKNSSHSEHQVKGKTNPTSPPQDLSTNFPLGICITLGQLTGKFCQPRFWAEPGLRVEQAALSVPRTREREPHLGRGSRRNKPRGSCYTSRLGFVEMPLEQPH